MASETSMTAPPSSIEIIPVKCKTRFRRFNLGKVVYEELTKNKLKLREKDIIVVSSKFAAVSEGRYVDMSKVQATEEARRLAQKYQMDPALAQLVIDESEIVLGGVPGFVLALKNGTLAPNAGIDLSNAPLGTAILYPARPQATANKLRKDLLRISKEENPRIRNLGIILSDSRVTPTRLGTVGVAIAFSGIRPTLDMRGRKDLFGAKLKFTLRALADQVATAAEIPMGEAKESIPLVLVRGVQAAFGTARTSSEDKMTISPEKCLIISGLSRTEI